MGEKEVIGKYEIVTELGRGGMGVVYKAWEESLRRHVAIKMLGDRLTQDEAVVTRFMREARSVADLNHPNVIQVFAVDTHEGKPYFAMEYIEGQSLSSLIEEQGKLSPRRAVKILSEVASGLSAAHNKGVVHRDIKPDNIMLTEHGGVKVLDFGIAQLEDQNSKLTGTGMAIGTPNYVSPEVCLAQDVDNRSDLFSLGVVFYEMLTGDKPFEADSPLQMMTNVVHSEVPDITKLNSEVEPRLRAILDHLLAKNPEERYQNAKQLLEDIKSYSAKALPAHAVGRAGAGNSPQAGGAGKAKWALAAVLVAGIAGASWWYTQFGPEKVQTDSDPAVVLTERETTSAPDSDLDLASAEAETLETPAEPASDDTALQTASAPDTGDAEADGAGSGTDAGENPATPLQAIVMEQEAMPASVENDGTDTSQPAEPAVAEDTPAAQTTQASPPPEPEPTLPAGPPRIVIHTLGDSAVTPTIKSTLKSMLENADFVVLNERVLDGFKPGSSAADISRVARNNGAAFLVLAEVSQTGTRTLTYYGNTDIQSLASLTVEVVSLSDRRSLGAALQTTLEYVALNAADQARAASTPLGRQIVIRLGETQR